MNFYNSERTQGLILLTGKYQSLIKNCSWLGIHGFSLHSDFVILQAKGSTVGGRSSMVQTLTSGHDLFTAGNLSDCWKGKSLMGRQGQKAGLLPTKLWVWCLRESFMGCCPLNNPTVSTPGSRVSLSLLSDNTIKLICFPLPDTSVLINSNLWCGRNWRAWVYS